MSACGTTGISEDTAERKSSGHALVGLVGCHVPVEAKGAVAPLITNIKAFHKPLLRPDAPEKEGKKGVGDRPTINSH